MSASWTVIGNVGDVKKTGKFWIVSIADNQYVSGKLSQTIWFNVMCKFRPRVKKSDAVIATGKFSPSQNKMFQYALIAEHIGITNMADHVTAPDENVGVVKNDSSNNDASVVDNNVDNQ